MAQSDEDYAIESFLTVAAAVEPVASCDAVSDLRRTVREAASERSRRVASGNNQQGCSCDSHTEGVDQGRGD